MIALGVALVCPPARAQPTIDVQVVPVGADAQRVGERVLELLEPMGVRSQLHYGSGWAPAASPGALAHVTIDIDGAHARALMKLEGPSFAAVTRAVPLLAGWGLDETASEEIAQIVGSNIDALLSREALVAGAAPSSPLPVPETETPAPLAGGGMRPRAVAVAAAAPPLNSARVATDREHAAPASSVEPVHEPEPALEEAQPPSERPRASATHVLAGYAFELWGDGHVLTGPWVALGHAVPISTGRIGVRLEGWFALESRLHSERLAADASVQAVRLLALYETSTASGLALELAAGLNARVTTLRAVDPPADIVALGEVSLASWGAHLYCGGRLNAGIAQLSLGAGVDLDAATVDFGVRQADTEFASTHAPARVRPAIQAGIGLTF